MPQHKGTAPATRQVTTKGFAILPHQLADTVPQEIKGAVRSVYPALHRHGWCSDEGSWASIKTLMDESGFGRDAVRAALRWLTSEGWVTREERPGYTPRYRVRIEDPQPPTKTHPYGKQEGTPTKNRRGPLLKSVGEQEPSNKNPRTRQRPPTHYVGFPPEGETHGLGHLQVGTHPEAGRSLAGYPAPGAGGTLAAVPQPQEPAPSPPKRNRMAKPLPFTPTQDDIPAALLPVEAPLRAFWAEKGGQRTKAAWTALLGNLERIQGHPLGGTDAIRQQLDNAIQSGWTSVTFSNWQKYGQPASIRRVSAGHDSQQAVLDRFLARCDDMEAMGVAL